MSPVRSDRSTLTHLSPDSKYEYLVIVRNLSIYSVDVALLISATVDGKLDAVPLVAGAGFVAKGLTCFVLSIVILTVT